MGLDLVEPEGFSKFVLCWTPAGAVIGGTATALQLADMLDIPVVNMFHESYKEEFELLCPGV